MLLLLVEGTGIHMAGCDTLRCKLTVAFPHDICSFIAKMNSQWRSGLGGLSGSIFCAWGSRFDMVTNHDPFLSLSDCS